MKVLSTAVLVLVVTAACSHAHQHTEPAPAATTTTRASLPAAPAPTSRRTASSTVPSSTGHSTFTPDQLQTALLDTRDLPPGFAIDASPGDRPRVCGRTATNPVAAATGGAVAFRGPGARRVDEEIDDFPATAGAYLDQLRGEISCSSYGGTTVSALPADQIAAGIDSRNGAVGIGVRVTTAAGASTDLLWIQQGDLVIALRNTGTDVPVAASIALAQECLSRMKNTLA